MGTYFTDSLEFLIVLTLELDLFIVFIISLNLLYNHLEFFTVF